MKINDPRDKPETELDQEQETDQNINNDYDEHMFIWKIKNTDSTGAIKVDLLRNKAILKKLLWLLQ